MCIFFLVPVTGRWIARLFGAAFLALLVLATFGVVIDAHQGKDVSGAADAVFLFWMVVVAVWCVLFVMKVAAEDQKPR